MRWRHHPAALAADKQLAESGRPVEWAKGEVIAAERGYWDEAHALHVWQTFHREHAAQLAATLRCRIDEACARDDKSIRSAARRTLRHAERAIDLAGWLVRARALLDQPASDG